MTTPENSALTLRCPRTVPVALNVSFRSSGVRSSAGSGKASTTISTWSPGRANP
ncbi:hypothetical protein MBAV_003473 [Candidatus Magnetobacterium bavaricum]|uniref:Uncharacterized protein n=1 Tax=Candidatus Magnetobacterium bavaricum TaxID=29290 RepID=A0A0F3GUJ0_9BACT|nr:hypothetical protein MBAV_003473 [Candidatus Magnetobacterium bavaricum]